MDLEQVRRLAESHYLTHDHPLLVIDLQGVRERYMDFKGNLPTVDVHFALKSLTDGKVALALAAEGCSFEVASLHELQLLGKLLTPAQFTRVFYSNPVKSKRSILAALIAGIRWFSVDSLEEIQKICGVADGVSVPRADLRLYLRLSTSNVHSVWPLSSKFGATSAAALAILRELHQLRVKLAGFTFHVGSQCLDATAWAAGLNHVDYLVDQGDATGALTERVLVNLGGGFPSGVTTHDVTLGAIATALSEALRSCRHGSRFDLAAEPGRFIASSSAVLVTRVLLKTTKRGVQWLYLDAGVYHGMLEPSQGVIGRVTATCAQGELVDFKLAGPSCDSADMFPNTVALPAGVREDDLLLIENSGAYALAYATGNAAGAQPGFNGFLPPSVYHLHK